MVPHAAACCLLARTLQDLGHRVRMVRCVGIFSRCQVMDARRLPFEGADEARSGTCADCVHQSVALQSQYGLPILDMRSFGAEEEFRRARAEVAAAPDDLLEFRVDGIPLGQACLTNLSLVVKVSNPAALDAGQRAAWCRYVESALAAYRITNRILGHLKIRALVHFNDYAILMGARLAAQRRGIPALFVTQSAHQNIDRRRYLIRNELWCIGVMRQEERWPDWRSLSLAPEEIRSIADDQISRFAGVGSHQFSPARTQTLDVRTSFGLDPARKLLVAYTSSYDEAMAAVRTREVFEYRPDVPPNPFPDQISWLAALIDHVEARADLQMIVRVHPREGATKGSGYRSRDLQDFLKRFAGPYRHTRIVWPEDPVSSYDLAEAADAALIAWTTMGVELARLGVPVLAAFRGINPYPIGDFIEWAPDAPSYFRQVGDLCRRAASFERILHTYRWYHQTVLGAAIDLGDVVPSKDFMGAPPYRRPRETKAIESVMLGGKDALDLTRERLLARQGPETAEAEREALRAELRRVVVLLLTGRAEDSPPPLRARADGSWVEWDCGVEKGRRYSPMAARLLPLLGIA